MLLAICDKKSLFFLLNYCVLLIIRLATFVKSMEEGAEQLQELVCNVIRQAAGNSFTLPARKVSVCCARKLEITLTTLSIVDIVSITTRNWLVFLTIVLSDTNKKCMKTYSLSCFCLHKTCSS